MIVIGYKKSGRGIGNRRDKELATKGIDHNHRESDGTGDNRRESEKQHHRSTTIAWEFFMKQRRESGIDVKSFLDAGIRPITTTDGHRQPALTTPFFHSNPLGSLQTES
ncbi:hypothetical protein L1887_20176 [Cichorium endivia]|nr:hypothetical protein L1887_20176 [Cichorium endivia]